MSTSPTPAPSDNSSTSRKIAVPALAGAVSILAVIAAHAVHLPVSESDYAVGAPALAVVVAAALDLILPDRFLG